VKLRIVYAVRVATVVGGEFTGYGFAWLADTCGGGTWTRDELRAVTFATAQDAVDALAAAEIRDGGSFYYARRGHHALEIVALVEEVRELPR
jgi:hypothetical protein